MLPRMPRPAQRLPPAPRAREDQYSVRVFQAPRENQRTLARLLRASGGELPESLRPKEMKTFQVQARSLHLARAEVKKKLETMGFYVRAINRGHRAFIVYVAHLEDVPNVPTDS